MVVIAGSTAAAASQSAVNTSPVNTVVIAAD